MIYSLAYIYMYIRIQRIQKAERLLDNGVANVTILAGEIWRMIINSCKVDIDLIEIIANSLQILNIFSLFFSSITWYGKVIFSYKLQYLV